MSVKIRLRRMGAKKRPFYRLVVADARSPRDGRFIEAVGIYDPLANPALVKIDAERVKDWMSKGARPTDIARQLLVSEGLLERTGPVFEPKPEKPKASRKAQAKAAAASAAPEAAAPAAEAPAGEAPATADEEPQAAAAEAPGGADAAAETEPEKSVSEEAEPSSPASETEPAPPEVPEQHAEEPAEGDAAVTEGAE